MQKINFGDDNTFIEKYKELKSSRKMAEYYHCSKNTITKHAKEIGYDYSGNKERKISTIPPDKVYEEYLTLGSCKKVAEKYNCSDTSVINYLKKSGYVLNNNYKLNGISDEDFIKLYIQLGSTKAMSEKFQCSTTAIINKANKIGFDFSLIHNYKLSDKDKQEIIAAYNKETSSELAKKYNVSRGMITKLWYDQGLINKTMKPFRTTEKDLTNQIFGHWTVLSKTDQRSASGGIMWLCRCSCGIEKPVSSLSLLNGTSLSCGNHSNVSKGNEKIRQLLQEAQIPFEPEKKFDSCKDKNALPFDFFVNNTYLIEFDGIQHYDKNSRFDYEYTHNHDIIKSKWCKENNIPLIRIPYTHLNLLSLQDLQLETTTFLDNLLDYAD